MKKTFSTKINLICASLFTVSLLLCSCGSGAVDPAFATQSESSINDSGITSSVSEKNSEEGGTAEVNESADSSEAASDSAEEVSTGPVKGSRDNTPDCLVPTQPGTEVYSNDLVVLDCSNSSEGYISLTYSGTSPKVKLQIACPNTTTYTYTLKGGCEVFPLTSDSGSYKITVYENIQGTQYSTAFSQEINANVTNEFGPYLYPNQYVNFSPDDKAIAFASELAYSANTDLEVVTAVYNYIIENIVYDKEFAEAVQSGYVPTIDSTLESGRGICLDYAALMAAMLRTQRIPTHMEVGYAGTAYHAWISVYLEDIGWVNGIIEFDGVSWELMDPTFASSADEKTLKDFIGDGSSYETKYIY